MIDFDILYNEKYNNKIKKNEVENLKDYLAKKNGWIYIAYSENNNLLKIGRTSKNPMERAKTLSTTGVLHDYDILFSLKVFNQFILEKEIHKKLKKFRIKKEFFSVNQSLAIETLEKEYEKELKLLNRFFDTTNVKSDLNLLEYSLVSN